MISEHKAEATALELAEDISATLGDTRVTCKMNRNCGLVESVTMTLVKSILHEGSVKECHQHHVVAWSELARMDTGLKACIVNSICCKFRSVVMDAVFSKTKPLELGQGFLHLPEGTRAQEVKDAYRDALISQYLTPPRDPRKMYSSLNELIQDT